MTAVDDVDAVIELYQLALDEFLQGNPEPVKKLWSHREDATLANPLGGPPARGWEQVAMTMEHAASQVRAGEITSIEEVAKYVTPELAYTVWLEQQQAKIGGREDVTPFALRVTMIFRPEEDGTWKIVHRHADPITTTQAAESVIQE
jgi:ketosteroid isomerase-like protein